MADIEPTPKLMNILYALANGRLPWGTEWDDHISLCHGLVDDDTREEYSGYVLCCGHTLKTPDETSPVIAAGLLLPGDLDKFGRRTLVITKAGRSFLATHREMVEAA